MKQFKLIFGVLAFSLITMVACEKEQVVQEVQNADESIILEPAQADEMEEHARMFEELERQGFEVENNTTKNACCALNTFQTVFYGTWINLNANYDINSLQHALHVKHWVKPVGASSYTYWGQWTIPSNVSECTTKGINIGTGQFASGTKVLSWARVYNGSGYCGSGKVIDWTQS